MGDRARARERLAPAQGQEPDQAARPGARPARSPRAAAELLWPDRTADSAANNLHQALYVARRALEAAGADALECLALARRHAGPLRGAPGRDRRRRVRGAAELARAAGTVEAYRDALALYRGELLPEDRYEDWTAGRREALRELHLALLLELAELHAGLGDAAGAVETLQRAVVDDPMHEEAHRRLMRLFAEVGRRQQALAQYQQLRQTLRREYEADPDPETRRLFQDILAGRLDPIAATEAPAESRPPGARRGAAKAGAAPRHNLPVAADQLRRARARAGRAARPARPQPAADADRPGRRRQDAARPGGGRRAAARLRGRRVAGGAGRPRRSRPRGAGDRRRARACSCAPQRDAEAALARLIGDRRAAARARQLRAPDRGVRGAGRAAPAAPAPS